MGQLLRANARSLGFGSICARLYIVDDPDAPGESRYPAALPSPNSSERVFGEVFEVLSPDVVFPELDAFEACSPEWPEPHEFLRRNVTVTMADGTECAAMTYLYTWDVSTAEHIPSGRYTEVSPDVR